MENNIKINEVFYKNGNNSYQYIDENTIQITNTRQKLSCIIDAKDFDLIKDYRWLNNNHGYWINGDRVLMHRLILGIANEEYDRNRQSDHINRIKSDNRRSNLRIVTSQGNTLNRSYYRKNGLPKGVRKERNGRWECYITRDKIKRYLGSFGSCEEAAQAFVQAAQEYEAHSNCGVVFEQN